MALSQYFGQGPSHNRKEHSVRELVVQNPQNLAGGSPTNLPLPGSAVHCADANCPVYTKVSKLGLKKIDAPPEMKSEEAS